MKKLLALILALLMVCSMTACSFMEEDDEDEGERDSSIFFPGTEREEDEDRKFGGSEEGQGRDPMPNYDWVGASNTMATSDGRYIYYAFKTNSGGLCRTDMNGENAEELYDSWVSNLYIDDGYLYYGHGVVLKRVDIATGPQYFNGSDGYIYAEDVVDKEMLGDRLAVGEVRSDDEYIYITASGLSRLEKGTRNLEEIAYGEDFINFYDLTVENGFVYAFCRDDYQIYRMNPDGSDATAICHISGTYQIFDGYVYNIEMEDGVESLMRTGLDDGKTECVGTLSDDGYVFASLRNAMAGKLYYVCSNANDKKEIRSYDLTTGEDSLIVEVDAFIDEVDVVGDFIFFRCNDDSLTRVNADGSGLEQVG